jgi:hypothetical protein
VIFGKNGIVYSKVYKEAQYQETFNVSFRLTSEMAPKADVIIFYLRDQDGNIIFDQFELNLGFQGSNFVSNSNVSYFLFIIQNFSSPV